MTTEQTGVEDFETGNEMVGLVKKSDCEILNSDKNVQVSDTTEAP